MFTRSSYLTGTVRIPDEPPAGGAAPEGAPEPAAATPDPAPAPEPSSEPAPEPASEPDPFDNEETASFDRAYVEKLRKEAAGHRTKASELGKQLERYSTKFADMDEDDQEAFLWLAEEYRKNPEAAAEHFLKIGQSLKPTPDDEAALDQPMTRREWIAEQERMAQEQQTAKIERDVEAIQERAVKLGYTPGDPDYVSLLYITAEDEKAQGDIEKAHKIMEKRRQQIIDDYVAGKTDKARNGIGTPAPSGVPATSGGKTPKTMADAEASMRERLKASPGA